MRKILKKNIKKILQKNRKIMKNLKCKMKKMTYPPISQTTLITTKSTFLMVAGPKQTKT